MVNSIKGFFKIDKYTTGKLTFIKTGLRERTYDLRDFLWSYWRKEYRVRISGFKKVRKVVVSVRYGGPNTISDR